MEKEEIFNQIKGYLQQLFEIDPDSIKPESHLFTELGLDSIDAVDLVVQLQRATGRKIKPEDFKQVRTVNDVVEAVKKLLDQPEDAPDSESDTPATNGNETPPQ